MFLGNYQTKFSGKGRVILPKKFREGLLGGKEIILSRGFERCILGYSKKGFENQAKQLLEGSVTDERSRLVRRYLFSASEQVDLDSQGRFVIPSTLLAYANIKTEVILIGAGDHFEVWDVKLWNEHLKILEGDYGRVS